MWRCIIMLLSVLALQRAPAAAQATHRLTWDPAWPEFRPSGYVLATTAVLGAIGSTVLFSYPSRSGWSGGILFDDAVRNAMRARDPGTRDVIRLASDLTLITSVLQVSVLDSVILPIADRSPRVATQLSLINAEAFALDILVSTVLFKVVARERPLGADCAKVPDFDPLCEVGRYASFPSSHTSTSFTAAGLACVHHGHLPLYGGAWDVAACIESLALATATGLFRIIGDRHYATDVLLGAAIGFTIGYVYPLLVHYSGGQSPQQAPSDLQPSLQTRGLTTNWLTQPTFPYGFSIGGVL